MRVDVPRWTGDELVCPIYTADSAVDSETPGLGGLAEYPVIDVSRHGAVAYADGRAAVAMVTEG